MLEMNTTPHLHDGELQYVRDAAGKFFLEVPKPEGGYRYEPAEAGLEFVPADPQRTHWIAVRSVSEARRQRDPSSSVSYLESLKTDPATVQRNLARQKRFERQLNNITLSRVTPHQGPRVEFLTDEKFTDLHEQYRRAQAEGKERDCPFKPLSTYVHKLQLPDGSFVRPLFQGEVGLMEIDERRSTILVLQQGYGTGNFVQVSDTVEKRDEPSDE